MGAQSGLPTASQAMSAGKLSTLSNGGPRRLAVSCRSPGAAATGCSRPRRRPAPWLGTRTVVSAPTGHCQRGPAQAASWPARGRSPGRRPRAVGPEDGRLALHHRGWHSSKRLLLVALGEPTEVYARPRTRRCCLLAVGWMDAMHGCRRSSRWDVAEGTVESVVAAA